MLRSRRYWVVWPMYFDSERSWSQGRRVPRSLAVPAPKLSELERAARMLGLECIPEPDKRHPSCWWEPQGRLLVEKRGPKPALLRELASALRKLRGLA